MADWAAAGDTRPEPPWLDDRGSGYRLGLLWEAWGGGWCVSCQAVGHGGLPVGYNNEPEAQAACWHPVLRMVMGRHPGVADVVAVSHLSHTAGPCGRRTRLDPNGRPW